MRVRVYGLVACLRAHARVSLQPSPAICLEAGSWLLHSAVCSVGQRADGYNQLYPVQTIAMLFISPYKVLMKLKIERRVSVSLSDEGE